MRCLVAFHSAVNLHYKVTIQTTLRQGNTNTNPDGGSSIFVTTSRLNVRQYQRFT